jgi:predicted membrane protein
MKFMRNRKSITSDAGPDRSTAAARTIRTVSFLAALTISAALMLFPFLLRHVPGSRLHTVLPIMLFGVAGALVHGVGYRPDNALLRILLGPICAWSMIVSGMLLLFA